MPRLIIEGVPLENVQWFFKLLDLYGKLDKWWINEIELPISGVVLPGAYDESDVENAMLSAFKSVIFSLYRNDDILKTKVDGEKA